MCLDVFYETFCKKQEGAVTLNNLFLKTEIKKLISSYNGIQKASKSINYIFSNVVLQK